MRIYIERLLSGLQRLNKSPGYSAPHRVTGFRSSDGAKEWEEPETVYGRGRHVPKRGKVEDIREATEATVEELLVIDAKRDELKRALAALDTREREILKADFPVARVVTVAELKPKPE